MLIDAIFDENMVKAFNGAPCRIKQGVYVDCVSNFHNFMGPGWKDREEVVYNAYHSGQLTLMRAVNELSRIPAYGVVDSPEQFLERFGDELEKDPGQHAVGFTRVTKEKSPYFRWHKNGEYYGTQKRQYEHLGDEEAIAEVYTFTVMTSCNEVSSS
jgi:hypothetical protein